MDHIRKYIRLIFRMGRMFSNKALKETDLSPSEMDALRAITFHDDMSQQSLATHLGIDKAAVTRIVAKLEQKQYISRINDEKDKRIKRLCATQSALNLREELIAIETNYYNHIFEGVDREKLKIVEEVLEIAFEKAKDAKIQGFENI